MTIVVATHSVGNMDTWLSGGNARKATFAGFCSSYRIFKHTDSNKVSVVWENADVAKMKAALSTPEAKALQAKHSVIEPIEIYVEVDGGK